MSKFYIPPITVKDFIEPMEEWAAIFKCPRCHQEVISQYDKYCSNCGTKIRWDKSCKEYFV